MLKKTGPNAFRRVLSSPPARSRNDETRKDFALALGVSEMTLRRWLSGRVAIPEWVGKYLTTGIRDVKRKEGGPHDD